MPRTDLSVSPEFSCSGESARPPIYLPQTRKTFKDLDTPVRHRSATGYFFFPGSGVFRSQILPLGLPVEVVLSVDRI